MTNTILTRLVFEPEHYNPRSASTIPAAWWGHVECRVGRRTNRTKIPGASAFEAAVNVMDTFGNGIKVSPEAGRVLDECTK